MPDNQFKNFVNKRFFECIQVLKKQKVVSSDREFAQTIGISPSNLGDIKASRRSVTIEILNNSFKRFRMNSAYVITGKGSPFMEEKAGDGNISEKAKEVVVVATQDAEGNVTVPLINHKAAANYLTGYQSQEWFEEQENILLPSFMLKNGICYALQVNGDSMEPTLSEDDWVICRLLDGTEYSTIVDGGVYVIVSEQHGIQIKRVKNRLHQYGFVKCISDNPKHEPYEIRESDLLQIWKVEWHLRSYLPENSHEWGNVQDKLESMELEMKRLQDQINDSLSQT